MQIIQLVQKLGRNDLKLIVRDSFMVGMFLFVVYIGIAVRLLLPWANNYFAKHGILPSETIESSLADYYPLIVAFIAIFNGALIIGTMAGFLLIGEKDDKTLTVMLVTPVPINHYIMYRVGLPITLAFLIILALILFINQALVPLWQMLLISAGGALTAPIVSLFYAIYAKNKIQGFAFGKFVGIAGWFILLGWFVEEPFQWLFGLFPPFLISKAYWMVLEGSGLWWVALVVGILLQITLIRLLLRRFVKVVYK